MRTKAHLPDPVLFIGFKLDGINQRTSCEGCAHRRPLGRADRKLNYTTKYYTVCHYLLDTGKPRGCPAERCNKKERKAHDSLPAGLPG